MVESSEWGGRWGAEGVGVGKGGAGDLLPLLLLLLESSSGRIASSSLEQEGC